MESPLSLLHLLYHLSPHWDSLTTLSPSSSSLLVTNSCQFYLQNTSLVPYLPFYSYCFCNVLRHENGLDWQESGVVFTGSSMIYILKFIFLRKPMTVLSWFQSPHFLLSPSCLNHLIHEVYISCYHQYPDILCSSVFICLHICCFFYPESFLPINLVSAFQIQASIFITWHNASHRVKLK